MRISLLIYHTDLSLGKYKHHAKQSGITTGLYKCGLCYFILRFSIYQLMKKFAKIILFQMRSISLSFNIDID